MRARPLALAALALVATARCSEGRLELRTSPELRIRPHDACLRQMRRQSVADLRDAVRYWRRYVERHASVPPASADALRMVCTFLATTAGRPISRPASRLLRTDRNESADELHFDMDALHDATSADGAAADRLRSAQSFSSLVRTHLEEQAALATVRFADTRDGRSNADYGAGRPSPNGSTDDGGSPVVHTRPRAFATSITPPPRILDSRDSQLSGMRLASPTNTNPPSTAALCAGVSGGESTDLIYGGAFDNVHAASDTPVLQDTLVFEATLAAIRRDPEVFPVLLDTLLAPDRTGAEHYARVLAHVIVADRADLVPSVIAHARRRSAPLVDAHVALDARAYGAWAAALVTLAAAGHAAVLAAALDAEGSPFGALPVAGAAASQVLAEFRAAPAMYAGAEPALESLLRRVSFDDAAAEMVDACIVALCGLDTESIGNDGLTTESLATERRTTERLGAPSVEDVYGTAFARAALYRHRILAAIDAAHAASLRGQHTPLPLLGNDALVALAILDAVPQAVAVDSLATMAALDWPSARAHLVSLGFAEPVASADAAKDDESTLARVFAATQSPDESLRGLRSRFRVHGVRGFTRVDPEDGWCEDVCALCLCPLGHHTPGASDKWGQYLSIDDETPQSLSPDETSSILDERTRSRSLVIHHGTAFGAVEQATAKGLGISPTSVGYIQGMTPDNTTIGRFSDLSSSDGGHALLRFACGHMYHEACAYDLVRDRPACALCNAPF